MSAGAAVCFGGDAAAAGVRKTTMQPSCQACPTVSLVHLAHVCRCCRSLQRRHCSCWNATLRMRGASLTCCMTVHPRAKSRSGCWMVSAHRTADPPLSLGRQSHVSPNPSQITNPFHWNCVPAGCWMASAHWTAGPPHQVQIGSRRSYRYPHRISGQGSFSSF